MNKVFTKVEELKNIKFNKTGYFRFKKFSKEKYLLTNDLGYYIFLNLEDFGNFINQKIEKISEKKQVELNKKMFLKNSEYQENFSKLQNLKNSYLKVGPSLHIMVLTLRCNHACKYCHANISSEKAKGKDMTIEKAKEIVDTIFFTTSNNVTIEFQGGEPLLNFEVLKFVIDYAREKAFYLKKNLSFALVTNLSLMSDEKMNYLLDNDISLSTSLDGIEEVHNYNRTFSKGNSFENVVYWIKKINLEYKKRGTNRKINALSTITRKSLKYPREIVDLFLDIGLDSIFIRPMNPYGFAAKNLDTLSYSYQEFNDFYNELIDYVYELNKSGIYIKEYMTTLYLQKIFQNVDPNFVDERSPCGATIGQVAYNYDGKIYTCDEGRMFGEVGDDSFLVGNVNNTDSRDKTYTDMISSDVTKSMLISSLTDVLPGYNSSVYKTYIGICPIYNYKNSGDIFSNYSLDNRIKISTNILDNIFSKVEDKKYMEIFQNWIGKSDYNKNCI